VRTHIEAQDALQAAGVPAGAALDSLELLSNPHVIARHGFEYVDTPGIGPTPYPRVAFTLSETPVPIERPAPGFGEANHYVLGELLGLSADAISALEEQGIVARVPTGGH
jgi:crotonobetainyl-CoA:carnitine CoA-transferase CaiB-like acyl-CoA transferase